MLKKAKSFFCTIGSVLVLTATACQVPNSTINEATNEALQHPSPEQPILPGAAHPDQYISLLKGKRVGVFANHTAMVGSAHLVDTLVANGIDVRTIFAPEHGFRGNADAGEKVGNSIDPKTGIAIISLYGSKRKPSAEELEQLDILVFDIQDVGLRYYTYISSLEEYMNAAYEAGKPVVVMDRPNPNGYYVDGPVLEPPFRSFVGMQPVPVVYGMTMGEYALMLVGEKWLSNQANAFLANQPRLKDFLTIIHCSGYTHSSYYALPIAPSPNLPDMQSVLLYASTCYFEGTPLSLGRGTKKPFQVYGHPTIDKSLFSFTPRSVEGAKNPPQLNQTCFGRDLSQLKIDITKPEWKKIRLEYLIDAYDLFPGKDSFFLKPGKTNPQPQDYFFNKLAGNAELMKQIKNKVPESEIRKSWEPGIEAFMKIRRKYLLYPDFEHHDETR